MNDQQTVGTNTFDKYEKRGAYHWEWYRTNRNRYRDMVNRVVECFPRQGTILDVGCGDALISYRLAERGLNVHGIDTSEVGISLGKQSIETACKSRASVVRRLWSSICKRTDHSATMGWVKLSVQSVYDLDESRTCDFVLCHEVIEHVPDPHELIRVVASVTGAFGVFTTPNSDFVESHPLDYYNWNPESFLQLFGEYKPQLQYVNESTIHLRASFD